MDGYFIRNINWDNCTNPINAIDFIAHLDELEKLAGVLEMLGLTLYEPVAKTFYNNQDEYFTLDIKGTCVEIMTCDARIAPVPTQYIDTVIPALILAHLNDPESVKKVYNDFFINKKEEITPLLSQ